MELDLDVDEIEECEGCGALLNPEHTHRDIEGVVLCDECWDDCPLASPVQEENE
jgi:recombinational DNA repair protein (RecF pathway)